MSISAVQKAHKVLPPPSPFGELLRRSRFAAYDPDIRQAYSAPASYTHRGNWGLKRPIANRHRKAHIVLRQFEEHAQYIEWDRADSQVKFIRRVEELNTAPGLVPNTPWFRGLGQVATAKDSGLDSDFCPGESSDFERYRDERFADEEVRVEAVQAQSIPIPPPEASPIPSSSRGRVTPTISLSDLGKSGKGAYGAKAPIPKPVQLRADESRLQPNINAMSPAEFKKYVEKLRALRPHFLAYMREQLQRDRDRNRKIMSTIDPQDLTDEELILNLGLEAKKKNLHMAFLGRYTDEHLYSSSSSADTDAPAEAAALANTPQPIRKQPHKFGGLMYAEPTELETYYSAKPEAGFVLQDMRPSSGGYQVPDASDGQYLAAFAGFTAVLRKRDAGNDVRPLYEPFTVDGLQARRTTDPVTGRVTFSTEDSERKMRLVGLELEEAPHAVGRTTSNRPLDRTKIKAFAVVDKGVDQNWRENPYTPGSREYNGLMPPTAKPVTRPPFRYGLTNDPYFNNGIRGRLPVSSGKARMTGPPPKASEVLESLGRLVGVSKQTADDVRKGGKNV